MAAAKSCVLEVRINQILNHLLPAAAVRGRVTFLEHDFFERFEVVLAGFDFRAQAAVPACITFAEQFFELAVGVHRVGDFEAAGEGVHAADVGVEQVDRLEAFAADFGIEVDAELRNSSRP